MCRCFLGAFPISGLNSTHLVGVAERVRQRDVDFSNRDAVASSNLFGRFVALNVPLIHVIDPDSMAFDPRVPAQHVISRDYPRHRPVIIRFRVCSSHYVPIPIPVDSRWNLITIRISSPGPGGLAVKSVPHIHSSRGQISATSFREERRDESPPRPTYIPSPSQPFTVRSNSDPDLETYGRSHIRPDVSDPTRCLRPAVAVFDYLTKVDVAID